MAPKDLTEVTDNLKFSCTKLSIELLLFTSAMHPPGSLILLGWGSVTEQEEDPVESVYYRAAKNVRHILIGYFTLTVSEK